LARTSAGTLVAVLMNLQFSKSSGTQ